MKNRLPVVLPICLLLVVMAVSGCSKISAYQKSIYDDDTKIAAKADSYSFVKRTGKFYDDTLSIRFSSFTGKQTLWEMNAKEDGEVSLDYRVTLTSGKFKICFITAEKEVITLTEATRSGTKSLSALKGKSYLSIVGNGADGSLEMKLTPQDGVTLKEMTD